MFYRMLKRMLYFFKGLNMPIKKSDSDSVHRFLRDEVLSTLCSKVPATMVATIFIATWVVVLFWQIVEREWLVGWYVLLSFLALERMYHAIHGCRYRGLSIEASYQRFRIEVMITALLWAFAAFFFFPEDQTEYQLLLALIVAGISSGGAITLVIDKNIAQAYSYLPLSALALRFLMCGDTSHLILFGMALVFMVILGLSIQLLGNILSKGILQRSELTAVRNRLDMILDQTPTGIFYYDLSFKIIDCNQALSDLMGVSKERLIGLDLTLLHNIEAFQILKRVVEEKNRLRYEGPYTSMLSGKEIWISAVVAPLFSNSGKIIGAIAVLEDKTKEHEVYEKYEFLALHDELTGLPNRKLLADRYRLQTAQAARNNQYSALLFLDLDKFKHVNDTYGHTVGDELLKEATRRLQMVLRQSDTVCRLGGDEFIIFLPMISSDLQESVMQVQRICEKIHRAISEPCEINGLKLYNSTSIGAVMIAGMDMGLDEVLRCADISMYHAKKLGRGITSFYEVEMDEKVKQAIKLEHRLRQAIERNELEVYYQPIVDIVGQRMKGAEALLRWKQSDGTMVSPAEFIPIAEESRLIHPIGDWLIDQVCQSIAKWQREECFVIDYVSINLSPRQVKHTNFFENTMSKIKNSGIENRAIKFEITESVLMDESEQTKAVLERFIAKGIGFLIDDFGTGYSSLSYLKRYHFESLKIDRSFIRDILTDEEDVTLVRAILDIAKEFGYRVIAEGVEKDLQREKLASMDPSIFYQGYLFSRPMDHDNFSAMLKKS